MNPPKTLPHRFANGQNDSGHEILALLKNETREWHARVETMAPVLADGFTVGDYRRLLERFYGFYAGFEPAIGRAYPLQELLPDWDLRRKLPWLESDLLWLGCTKADISRLPVCSRFPCWPMRASVLGALYVTEGSTLGGQLISRHLARSLQLLPGQGASFFSGPGPETGSRWKAFTKALTRFATEDNSELMVESAVNTYRVMWLWLSGEGENKRQ